MWCSQLILNVTQPQNLSELKFLLTCKMEIKRKIDIKPQYPRIGMVHFGVLTLLDVNCCPLELHCLRHSCSSTGIPTSLQLSLTSSATSFQSLKIQVGSMWLLHLGLLPLAFAVSRRVLLPVSRDFFRRGRVFLVLGSPKGK